MIIESVKNSTNDWKERGKRVKKLGVVFLIVVMLFSMTACNSDVESDEPVASENVEGKSLAEQVGTVKVGTDGAYPPFNYVNDEGKLTGLEIEILDEISKRTGLNIEVEAMAWDGIFGQMDSNKIDSVACCIFPSKERLEKYIFSREYIYDENRFIVRKGDESKIKTFDDLEGLKVGCTGGGNTYLRLKELQDSVDFEFEIVAYSEEREAYDLSLGRLDAIYKSPVSALEQAKQGGFELGVAECPPLEKASCAFPFRMNDERSKLICDAFTKAIQEMIDDGTMAKLSEKWTQLDLTAYEPLLKS
jgi:ABC-type amino acid transport substrate-binding protein